jgi:P-type Cu+ transporter
MNKHIDPVCGMTVDPATAAGQFEYAGQTYYFCNPHCLQKFSAEPQSYLNKSPQPHAVQPMVQLGSEAKSLPVMQAEPQTDPVCGMQVNPATAAGKYEYQGQTYYFCSPHCLQKFSADPEAVLDPRPQPAAQAEAEYTCPMDPEVRQRGPGACPKCGMALEPVNPILTQPRPNTSARCTQRLCAPHLGHARSAAWRWNRVSSRWQRPRTRN